MTLVQLSDADAAVAEERRRLRFGGGTTSRLFRRYFTVMALGTCGILLPALAIEMIFSYTEGLRTIEREQTIRADAAAARVASQIDVIETQIREVATFRGDAAVSPNPTATPSSGASSSASRRSSRSRATTTPGARPSTSRG